MANQIRLPKLGQMKSWSDLVLASADDEVAASVTYFRHVLGDDWAGWADGAPLANAFFTAFQQARTECVRLHHMIMLLDGTPNLECVVEDLGSPSWSEYVAAVMTLEFCSRLRAAGHSVEFIAPSPPEQRPDARLMLGSRWVTVEFKGLHNPDAQGPWDTFIDQVISGLCLQSIQPDAFDLDLAEPARNCDHTVIVEFLRGRCTSQDRHFQDLPSGAGRARFTGQGGKISFPVAQYDDIARVTQKLRQRAWSSQLATAMGVTLLVIKSRDTFAGFDRSYLLDRAIDTSTRLISVLADLPEIGAVLLFEEPFVAAPPPFWTETPQCRVSVGTSDGQHARIALLVPNPAAKVALGKDEIDTLVGPRMQW